MLAIVDHMHVESKKNVFCICIMSTGGPDLAETIDETINVNANRDGGDRTLSESTLLKLQELVCHGLIVPGVDMLTVDVAVSTQPTKRDMA